MTRRIAQLLVGLALYGVGLALMVRATVGVAPWDVLTQGIAAHSGWSFGLITNVVGALLLLAWIPLRQRPGLGTLLNVVLIGPVADLALRALPAVQHLGVRTGLFAVGLVVVALATGLYIGSHLGPGPRDGLMTGLHVRTGMPVWVARTGIEVTVLAAGWVLGGNVGLGTVAFALLIGPLCQRAMPFFDLDAHGARTWQARSAPRARRSLTAGLSTGSAPGAAPAPAME